MDCWQVQIHLLQKCDHPNINRLFEHYTGGAKPCLVIEFFQGKSLQSFCKTHKGRLSEARTGFLVKQALSAVAHLHQHRYCHLEITVEDFYFTKAVLNQFAPWEELHLKLVSMGAARPIEDAIPELGPRAASMTYNSQGRAPEQVESASEGVQDDACTDRSDVWAVGVLAHYVLVGDWPIVKAGVSTLQAVPENARHFFRLTLAVEPRNRAPAAQVLESSKWLMTAHQAYRTSLDDQLHVAYPPQTKNSRASASSQQGPRRSILKAPALSAIEIVQAFQSMAAMTRLQRVAITAAVHRLPMERTDHIRRSFDRLDVNGDGTLTVQELLEGLGEAVDIVGSHADLGKILDKADTDGNHRVDWTEFVCATYACRQDLRDEVCEAVFALFDQDHSGTVSIAELRHHLGSDSDMTSRSTTDTVMGAMRYHDSDGDGVINFEEFKMLLRGKSDADRDVRNNPARSRSPRNSTISKRPQIPKAGGGLMDQLPRDAALALPSEGALALPSEGGGQTSRSSHIVSKVRMWVSGGSVNSASSERRQRSGLVSKALNYVSTASTGSSKSRVTSAVQSVVRRVGRALTRESGTVKVEVEGEGAEGAAKEKPTHQGSSKSRAKSTVKSVVRHVGRALSKGPRAVKFEVEEAAGAAAAAAAEKKPQQRKKGRGRSPISKGATNFAAM